MGRWICGRWICVWGAPDFCPKSLQNPFKMRVLGASGLKIGAPQNTDSTTTGPTPHSRPSDNLLSHGDLLSRTLARTSCPWFYRHLPSQRRVHSIVNMGGAVQTLRRNNSLSRSVLSVAASFGLGGPVEIPLPITRQTCRTTSAYCTTDCDHRSLAIADTSSARIPAERGAFGVRQQCNRDCRFRVF